MSTYSGLGKSTKRSIGEKMDLAPSSLWSFSYKYLRTLIGAARNIQSWLHFIYKKLIKFLQVYCSQLLY